MKRLTSRSITVLAIVAAMGVSIPSVASASSAAPKAHAHSSAASTAWSTWHATWVAYFDGLKSINLSYRSSVESARSAYFAARATATTEAERQAARTTFDAALAADLDIRVSAITAAGDPPAPPAGYNGTAFIIGFQAANVAFRASVVTAQSTFAQAIASAATADERRAARLTFEAAVANAVVVRSAALLALGTPPAHRGQPS